MATENSTLGITFRNELTYDVDVYDSFDPGDNDDAQSYFGNMTKLATVGANGGTSTITPEHSFVAVFVVLGAHDNIPIARFRWIKHEETNSYQITEANVEAMNETYKFIDFFTKNPKNPTSIAFQELLNEPSVLDVIKDVDQFFKQQPLYSHCTLETYMMGLTTAAQIDHKAGQPQPPADASYRLSSLVNLMGWTWPEEIPDIVVSDISCSDKGGILDFWAKIDLDNFWADGTDSRLTEAAFLILTNFALLLGHHKIKVNILFNHHLSLGVLGTRLQAQWPDLDIPMGGSKKLRLQQPTVRIDLDPKFKFGVFAIDGTIPFNISGKRFDALASMTIDNIEASVGVVIRGDNASLPAPAPMKGVHFDEFGVGMGLIFKPPAFVIGIEGKFHIGESSGSVALADDTFALVCAIEGDVPNPLYASFYVPKMDLDKVVEIFTDSTTDLDVPVNFTDLSFKWAENPMEPVVLPDGTLSKMAFGFSASMEIADVFELYGDLEIDLEHGVTAEVEMSPISLGKILEISGDGQGVNIKVDSRGNPIKNNLIHDTAKLQAALKNVHDKALVSPGGPVLKIQTVKQPYLHVDGKVSLFEIVERELAAEIFNDGIAFSLDFGSVLTEEMSCTLKGLDHFTGDFKFGIDRHIRLPTAAGVSMGSIPLDCTINAQLSIDASRDDVVLKAGGSFEFERLSFSIGQYAVGAHIKSISDLVENIGDQIEKRVKGIFNKIMHDASTYLHWIEKGAVVIVGDAASIVGRTLYSHFSMTVATDIAKNTKRILGYTADLAGKALHGAALLHGARVTLHDAAVALKGAGYTVTQVGSGLKAGFSATANEAAKALNSTGYAADEAVSALKSTFTDSVDVVGKALHYADYAPKEAAKALKTELGASAKQVAGLLKDVFHAEKGALKSILKDAGYAASEIGNLLGKLFHHFPW